MKSLQKNVQKRVLMPVANGTDALESSAIIKICRMAGLIVDIASVEDDVQVTLLPEMKFTADCLIKNCMKKYDAIILPGGVTGCESLRDSGVLKAIVSKNRGSALLGAICAAPAMVLAKWEMLKTPATCNPLPTLREVLENLMEVPDSGVVVSDDETQVTASGAPFSIAFAVKIVQILLGDEVASKMADAYLFDRRIINDWDNDEEGGPKENSTAGCERGDRTAIRIEENNTEELGAGVKDELEHLDEEYVSRKRRRGSTSFVNVIQIVR